MLFRCRMTYFLFNIMRNFIKFTLLGTVAIMSATACKQDAMPEATVNPTFDSSKNEVTTQFVLNVSTASGAPTKMTAADVQADGNTFRGMTDVHLLAYKLGYTPSWGNGTRFLYDVSDESSKAVRDYDLGAMLTQNEISESQSSRIIELSLPLETNAILLYGKAPKTKSKDDQGSVSLSGTALNSTLENVSFKLDNRLSNRTAFDQYADLMSRILTGILRSGRAIEDPEQGGYKIYKDNTYAFWWPQDESSRNWATVDVNNTPIPDGNTTYHAGYTMHRGSKVWREYGRAYAKNINDDSTDNVSLTTLEEVLGEAYYQITTIQVDPSDATKLELRAASSASVLRLIQDLYSILDRVLRATPTFPEDYIAQLVAREAQDRIGRFFEGNAASLSYRELTPLMQNVDTYLPERTSSDYTLITNDFFAATNRSGFPINLGLPAGSAIMQFQTVPPSSVPGITENMQFEAVEYLTAIPAYGMEFEALSIDNYRYPAELMYWTNSPIRTSDISQEISTYPRTVSTWDSESSWSSEWQANSSVKSTTRSVAVTKEVNYGTALLKSSVKYSAETVYDNNKGIHPAEDYNAIYVGQGNQFKVTGVLIGGVNEEVGWNFLAKNNGFNKMIYDNLGSTQSFVIPTYGTTSAPFYTMVWDNYNPELGSEQSKVYVALEIVNNTGKDIWGELNLIRNGGTFYLVGELNPSTATIPASMKTNGAVDLTRSNFYYPPFAADGKTLNIVRVFMQDYVTNVCFTFGPNSLKHAYVTMPDLRASQVSLGLSVDLKWEDGLIFEDVPLGGN